ncbi:hypothetical protein ACFVUW_10430 [Streptomyces xiamenensis]|uniref:hypothetical protein n=1 Tax=Streptomyces xiamenensis TaxID=408015 RepID=UPI0036EFE70C
MDLDATRDDRYERIVHVISDMDPDVIAVQEILGSTPYLAGDGLLQLAADTGLTCNTIQRPVYEDAARPALASAVNHERYDERDVNRRRYHTGLMWRPGIAPVPGGWRHYSDGRDFWHSLATLILDCGGPKIKVASFQGDPFRPDHRFNEARRVVSAFRDRSIPGVIGMDANGASSDRRADGEFYDADYCVDATNFEDLVYQAEWNDDPDAPSVVDRRAAEVMRRGRLHDVAPALAAPWEATTGHWTGENGGTADPWGPRRIDHIRLTPHLLPGVRGYTAWRTPDSLRASDHLPVVVDFDLPQ